MSASQELQHPVLAYVDLNAHIQNHAIKRQSVFRDSPVIEALNNIASNPFVSYTLESDYSECEFTGPGEASFGTLGYPRIDVIRSKSTPSSFGKGDQTVTDPTYRNGHEINAEDIKNPRYAYRSFDEIQSHLKVALGGNSICW